MRWLIDLIYGAVPAEFESAFGLDESVRRLAAATERWKFGIRAHEAAVGRVSRERVSLSRVIPYVRNSFKPFYIGEFREVHGRVVLAGRFTLYWWVKALLTYWFGFCALWTVLAMLPLLLRDPHTWWFPFAGAGMFAFGVGLVTVSKRRGSHDIPWLSRVIRDALSEPARAGTGQTDAAV